MHNPSRGAPPGKDPFPHCRCCGMPWKSKESRSRYQVSKLFQEMPHEPVRRALGASEQRGSGGVSHPGTCSGMSVASGDGPATHALPGQGRRSLELEARCSREPVNSRFARITVRCFAGAPWAGGAARVSAACRAEPQGWWLTHICRGEVEQRQLPSHQAAVCRVKPGATTRALGRRCHGSLGRARSRWRRVASRCPVRPARSVRRGPCRLSGRTARGKG